MRMTLEVAPPLSIYPHHINNPTLGLDRFRKHQHLHIAVLPWHQDTNPLLDNAGHKPARERLADGLVKAAACDPMDPEDHMILTLTEIYSRAKPGNLGCPSCTPMFGELLDIPNQPQDRAVADFRIAIGHECLSKHLNMIGIVQSPLCKLCDSNGEMNAIHLAHCCGGFVWRRYCDL
ncbi:hypothetical protein TNCV_4933261 [Trichonephila clavipes]|nr:hypothetical protein TNCV_4933261 [Trichonephila clavipes]